MKGDNSIDGKSRDFLGYVQLAILVLVVVTSSMVVYRLYRLQEAFVEFETHMEEHIAAINTGSEAPSESTSEVKDFQDVLSYGGDPYKGDPTTAKIAIVEFGDYECPYCAQAMPQIDQLLKDNPEVLFIYKNYPLPYHQNAKSAAIVALCAYRQDKFWEMHQTLFNNQANLGQDTYTQYAEGIALDIDEFTACLGDQALTQKVEADLSEGMKLKISGTPAFLVGRITSIEDTVIGIDGQIVFMNDLVKMLDNIKDGIN